MGYCVKRLERKKYCRIEQLILGWAKANRMEWFRNVLNSEDDNVLKKVVIISVYRVVNGPTIQARKLNLIKNTFEFCVFVSLIQHFCVFD